jgi:hypothetical protein
MSVTAGGSELEAKVASDGKGNIVVCISGELGMDQSLVMGSLLFGAGTEDLVPGFWGCWVCWDGTVVGEVPLGDTQ